MPRLMALLALAGLMIGCARYTTRGQAPYQYPKPPQSPQPAAGGVAATPQPAPVRTPASEADEARLVPPRPPQSAAGFAVNPPQPPQPPAVPGANGVVPAAAVQPAPTPAKPPSPAAVNLAALKKLSGTAVAKWESVTTYEARLVRRESVNGKDGQTEEVLFQFRKEPHSVYMKNTGQTGKGREVLYVKGKNNDKMSIVTGAGDGFTGLRVTKSPDDPLVVSKSRHSIRDAGFGRGIAQFAELVAKVEAGKLSPDALRYLGPVQRPEYPYPLECVEQAIRPTDEKHSPNGGTRRLFFDMNGESPSFGLPVLVITTEPGGKEVEYYCFDKFKLPANLTDADFDPARLDKKKRDR